MPREQVIRNQRERLYGAAVAVVSAKGFEATTVADLIEVAGVSRSDFYRHFANKAGCIAAMSEELVMATLKALETGCGGEGEAARAPTVERLIALVSREPAAARVCFVELYGAGKEADPVSERALDGLAAMIGAELDDGGQIDPMLTQALVGGLCKVIHTHLYRGEAAQLDSLAEPLWHWMASVKSPPEPLEAQRRARIGQGTRFEGYTPAERIARATAAVVAEKGYGSMNTDDIAARAAISLTTFYEHFADKRDAVLGALEMSGAQIMALAAPAARRAGHWQEGVRAFYEAICAYFTAEPGMAELAMVGVYGAGTSALGRRDWVIDSLAEMLAPATEENPKAPAVGAEAATAAVYALMREQVRKEGPQSMAAVVPLATYITLVGFVGPERACAVANGDGKRR
jgi:AcrR family transcriptional regulator